MSISSIFTQPGSSAALNPATQSLLTASTSQASSDGDSANISSLGQLMGQLQQLSTSNPSEFQQVTANIATQLQQDAQSQGGSAANFLNNLASKFQTASQTGSMASLEMHHHGGHHGGGGGGGSLQSLLSSASTGSSSSSSSQAASAYSSNSNQSVFSQVLSIIGQALSSAGTTGSPSAAS